MMGLGPYRFSIETAAYTNLQRTDEYRWESQERIGRHPAMQFIGQGHTTIRLEGTVYPTWKGGARQIDTMRAAASKGTPHVLVSGAGKIFGRFVIMNVEETQTHFFADGTPRKQEFKLEIKSYGEDGGL
jgi:phage protein U